MLQPLNVWLVSTKKKNPEYFRMLDKIKGKIILIASDIQEDSTLLNGYEVKANIIWKKGKNKMESTGQVIKQYIHFRIGKKDDQIVFERFDDSDQPVEGGSDSLLITELVLVRLYLNNFQNFYNALKNVSNFSKFKK